ncbi:hypothetical protein Tco_0558412 [Tanacetum coccineum]
MDFEVTNASTQQNPKQMDEEFTTTAYPSVQENLKLPTEDQLILKELASSVGTMSSLQNLDKELSLTNQFLMEKSHDDEPDKSNTKAEVQSMVMVPIHHHLFSSSNDHSGYRSHNVTTCELEQHMADLLQDNLALGGRLDKHGTRLYNLEKLDIPNKVSQVVDEIVTDAVDWAMQAPLRARFRDLPTVDMKEILQQRIFEDDSYKANNWSPPSQPPPPAGASVAPGAQELSPSDDLMHDDSAPDEQVHVSDDQDSRNDHTPAAADSRKDWWKPLPEEERPATPEPAWTIPSSHKSDVENNWASALATTYEPPAENSLLAKIRDMTTFLNSYCQRMNKTVLTQADFEGQAYEVVKAFYPDVIHLQFQMEECHKMLTDQVDWANPEGDQVRINGSCPALSISKMKAASYPDFGLELLVPEQMWIDDVCTYDVSAKYGISHWWFTRQKFYIDRHESPSRRKEVRTHMRILSVVRIKAYSRYGYDYLSEIVLRRADHQEHKIAEKDFKNLYPSDFEDLNLLLLQGHLDHLSGSDKQMLSTAVKLWTRNLVIRQRVEDFQLGIESYQTQLNLTKPGWDATGYEFKHDYTIIESPRAVIFPVNNNERKIMRFNKIYKFSDGTLTRILETLDYRVKEFKIKRLNPGMNTRFWTEKDVTRSKEFITAIERRLKTRRIYRNLECFVGDCVLFS